VNKEGKGPSWANSLFEDNAEHGLGLYLGQKKIRDDLKCKVEAIADKVPEAAKWLETYNCGEANQAATKDLVAALEKLDCGCDTRAELLEKKDFLNKKSCW
ncbi:MAG TPA: hypothetical protein DHU74_09275, partial [Clostridiales bacterium]|nr:hypothetical protein [Clostridiales bacterium]